MADETEPTNPGSMEALKAGCWCPQFKNDFGLAEPPEGWHIEQNCPLHDRPRYRAPADGAGSGGFDGDHVHPVEVGW